MENNKNFKNKKILWIFLVLLFWIGGIAATIGIGAALNNQDKKTQLIPTITSNELVNGPIFSEDDLYKIDDSLNTNNYFLTANSYMEKIINSNIPRKLNKQVYQTTLLQEWKSKSLLNSRENNGYPAYDFNWRIIYDYGSEYNQNFVKNYYNQVNNEKAESQYWTPTKDDGFKSAKFIRSEIKNNNLKQHPSAKWMHDPNLFVLDSSPAIEKEFTYLGFRKAQYNTGMYAAPGEIITLELTPEQFNLWKSLDFKGISLTINHQSFDQPREWGNSGMIADRYPYTSVEFDLNNYKFGEPTSQITDTSDWIFEDGVYKFQFGSPFGGSIGVRYNYQLKQNGQNLPIVFKISGGIEEVHYIQGQTTKEQWEQQLQRVVSGEITSPIIAIDSYWFNASCNMYNKYQFSKSDFGTPKKFPAPPAGYVPSRDDIVIGGYGVYYSLSSVKQINQLPYPYDMVKKWDDFIMLSSFAISADITNSPYKEVMRFGLEVWGGAAGWGGSYNFWTYPNEFVQMFFQGEDVMCATGNWLGMHEINHGYEPGNWNFNKLPHGVTNQITTLNLSAIGDVPRYRNIFNINGEWNNGWSRLTSPFANVSSTQNDAYSVFSDYLFTVGTGITFDYIRWQSNNAGKNGNLPKGDLNEIYIMSKFAANNFYYALRDLYAGQEWLPISKTYEDSTPEQKKLIDQLTKDLYSIDIVSNLYACGTYLFDPYLKEYVYTNDTVPAFEIPANINQYVFDFEKGIKSKNPNFQFKIKSFDQQTKLGGQLKQDPNNPKQLIYTPPKFNNIDDYSQIDEFNIEIVATHSNKYPNYVPGYKYKIKVRQNVKSASVLLNNVYYVAEKAKFVENMNSQIFEAKFIVPRTGKYKFAFKNLKGLELTTSNGQKLNANDQLALNANDVINIKYLFSKNQNIFDLKYIDQNGQETNIDLFSNIISPYIENSFANLSTIENKKINYSPRKSSSNGIGFWAKHYIHQPFKQYWQTPPTSDYTITLNYKNKDFKNDNLKLGTPGDVQFADANRDFPNVYINFDYKTPVNLSTMCFKPKGGNYGAWVPKSLIIKFIDVNGKEIYLNNGNPINPRELPTVPYDKSYRYLNFDQPIENVVKIKVIAEKETGQSCFALNDFDFLINKIDTEISNLIPFNSEFIKFDQNWQDRTNDAEHLSIINNGYKYTNTPNSTMEFKILGNGFTIIGTPPKVDSFVEVYINDELVSNNLNIKSDVEGCGQNIIKWFASDTAMKEYHVKIVFKSSSNIYVDGIGISSLFNKIGRIIKIK